MPPRTFGSTFSPERLPTSSTIGTVAIRFGAQFGLSEDKVREEFAQIAAQALDLLENPREPHSALTSLWRSTSRRPRMGFASLSDQSPSAAWLRSTVPNGVLPASVFHFDAREALRGSPTAMCSETLFPSSPISPRSAWRTWAGCASTERRPTTCSPSGRSDSASPPRARTPREVRRPAPARTPPQGFAPAPAWTRFCGLDPCRRPPPPGRGAHRRSRRPLRARRPRAGRPGGSPPLRPVALGT